MSEFRFRPRLVGLEDRVTPSATPTQLLDAAQQVQSASEALQWASAHLAEVLTPDNVGSVASALSGLAQTTNASGLVLFEGVSEVSAVLDSTPKKEPLIRPILNALGSFESQAESTTSLASNLATALGAPPVALGAGTGTSTGTTTTDPNAIDPGLSGPVPSLTADGWTATADGLRTRDVKVGQGTAVQASSSITVQYTGWLTDGTVFDSSLKTGKAATFALSGVIKGWQEGLIGMQPGGIRQLDVPPALGYGSAGFPPTIPANAELVFEIQLVSVS
jgi:hypothetical protein